MTTDANPSLVFVDLLQRAAAGESTSFTGECDLCRRDTTWRLVSRLSGRDYYQCSDCGAIGSELNWNVKP